MHFFSSAPIACLASSDLLRCKAQFYVNHILGSARHIKVTGNVVYERLDRKNSRVAFEELWLLKKSFKYFSFDLFACLGIWELVCLSYLVMTLFLQSMLPSARVHALRSA